MGVWQRQHAVDGRARDLGGPAEAMAVVGQQALDLGGGDCGWEAVDDAPVPARAEHRGAFTTTHPVAALYSTTTHPVAAPRFARCLKQCMHGELLIDASERKSCVVYCVWDCCVLSHVRMAKC